MVELYFPHDEAEGANPNFDSIADYLELNAFFSEYSRSSTSELVNARAIGAEEDYSDVDDEITRQDALLCGVISRLEGRARALSHAYPFELDNTGHVLIFRGNELSYGQAAYILALILSHLQAVSPILQASDVYPTEEEIRQLRQFFQYFATAALAAEVHGRAWSFGYPRPDSSGFHQKLTEIWEVLKDGVLQPSIGVPKRPKDDQIDVFAARQHRDGLPGFLLAATQVATGANWQAKSLRSHVQHVFNSRWFGQQPVTAMVCYHIIPFTRRDDEFYDDCRCLGNVLHRLRVPYRVEEAHILHEEGVSIEAFDELERAVDWVRTYSRRGETAR